jgi:threonine aldolase
LAIANEMAEDFHEVLGQSLSSLADLNALFAVMSDHGIRVTSLRNKSNRLEELFMGLVEGKGSGGQAA